VTLNGRSGTSGQRPKGREERATQLSGGCDQYGKKQAQNTKALRHLQQTAIKGTHKAHRARADIVSRLVRQMKTLLFHRDGPKAQRTAPQLRAKSRSSAS
jgi:hypothetical protein